MRAITFILAFGAFFALSVAFMAVVDALPEPVAADPVATDVPADQTPADTTVPAAPEAPVRVVAKDVGINVTISNPSTTDAEALDAELLHGAVRWPESAMLGVDGTVALFGHSSYLPIVQNQAFKAFTGIQKLKVGQTISVYSDAHEYRYAVTGVRLANADEDVVELPETGQYLVLITCDSFATKSDRFVITATLAGTYPL